MVFWMSSSKSCTPMEARFIPAAASASRRAPSISFGSISTENSVASVKGAMSRIAPASSVIIAGANSVGVPPPQCSRDSRTPAGSSAAQHGDLGLERLEIGDHRRVGLRALGAAGAEPAQPAAERHMHVERYLGPLGIAVIQSAKSRDPIAPSKCGAVG